VAIFLSPTAKKAWERAGANKPVVSGVVSNSARWMGIQLKTDKKKPKDLFVVTAYHPHSGTKDDIVEEYYKAFDDFISKHNKPRTTVIIGCDANCPLGTTADNDDEDSEIIGRNGDMLRRKNESNYHLRNLLHKQQLRATNLDYAHKRYDTFYHFSTRTTTQLDYFFATKNARPSIHDMKQVSKGVESDHAAVMLKLHLQNEKRVTSGYQGSRPKRSPIDWRELKGDEASTYAGIVQGSI
jgi:exonuclease III